MTRGRPRLPEGERLVHVSLRLPQWLVDWYGEQGNRSARMRRALEKEAGDGSQAATTVIQAYGDARADAARREALEEAAKVADGYAAAGKDNPQLAPISAQMRYCAQRIRALKENPNAG